MTEPDTGSDLAGVRTFAERRGDHYVLSGQKTFITNGLLANLVIVVARTDHESRHAGLTLLVVESTRAGYEPPRKLDKVGLRAQDTAELFFTNIEVPVENRLGEEGKGFYYLMQQLPRERLSIACTAMASARPAWKRRLATAASGTRLASHRHARIHGSNWPKCKPRFKWARSSSIAASCYSMIKR